MTAAYLKIGTMPLGLYFVRGNKGIRDYQEGDKITFRPQMIKNARWEHGIITQIEREIPFVSLQ
ncbi:MAG: hypothetical protein WC197_07995 [Candidatus Gastranaerophilaceae bacterium]|jgi:hypothetical protein